MASSFAARLRRGHLIPRLRARALREVQSALTTLVLSTTRARPGHAAIVTLNADEENATVQAVLLGSRKDLDEIVLVTPSVEASLAAVQFAARRLEMTVPRQLSFRQLNYCALLAAYRKCRETYSTHVLLPGRDFSGRRRHMHLTHGSGPKPDATFRSPANVLASITPHWVPQQLAEYRLPAHTEVVRYMPRLEVMRRAVGDTSILERLGLDPKKPLVVWAPTYRSTQRGGQLLESGLPVDFDHPSPGSTPTAIQIINRVIELEAQLVLKVHPHDAHKYQLPGVRRVTNSSLASCGVTPYELFGVASQVITDYSSIYSERMELELPFLLYRPDLAEFSASQRGLRDAEPQAVLSHQVSSVDDVVI